jgi:hypothetical protein
LELARRNIVRLGIQIISLCVFPMGVVQADGTDTCTDSASEGLRNSMHYTGAGPDPRQTCSGCAFFNQDGAKQPCGQCVILSSPVNPKGHCDSWSAKQ